MPRMDLSVDVEASERDSAAPIAMTTRNQCGAQFGRVKSAKVAMSPHVDMRENNAISMYVDESVGLSYVA